MDEICFYKFLHLNVFGLSFTFVLFIWGFMLQIKSGSSIGIRCIIHQCSFGKLSLHTRDGFLAYITHYIENCKVSRNFWLVLCGEREHFLSCHQVLQEMYLQRV